MKYRFFTSLVLIVSVIPTAFSTEENAFAKILPQHCIFAGEFKQQRHINGLTAPLHSQGTFFFNCQQGLLWHSTQPFTESLIYTTKNLHFRSLPETEPETLEGPHHHYLAKLLLDLLSAKADAIAKDFSITTASHHSRTRVILSPISDTLKKGLDSITLESDLENHVDNRDNREQAVLSIAIRDIRQQRTDISIQPTTYLGPNNRDAKPLCYNTVLSDKNSCNLLSTPEQFYDISANH